MCTRNPHERQRLVLRPREAAMFDDFYVLDGSEQRKIFVVCIALKLSCGQF